MSWPPAMPMVRVAWVDSASRPGWAQPERWDAELADDPQCQCETVGWLFRDLPERVIIAQNRCQSGQVGELMEIPRAMVTAIEPLEPKHGGRPDEALHGAVRTELSGDHGPLLPQEEGAAADV